MPEYIVRTLPGETTVRVSRPGGTSRVRTRLTSSTVYVTGGGGGDHNDTTNRDAADAHPISAITGLQDALDALTGGGGSNLRVDVAVVDDTDSIDLDGAAPGDVPAVLVWGRASGNGVYEASVADGWTLLDPQPTLVVADALVQAPSFDPVLDTGVASIYDYSDTAGWQPVGSVPTLDGNPSQVWGPSGWVTPDGGASALADLTDVDVVSDPPAQDDVLAWDDTAEKWTPATLDGGVALSDATPQDLGTAAAGVSEDAARADHVHDMPNAADIAVDASGFNGNLTTSDDTVQEIAQKLDDLVIPAAGIADPGGSNDDFLQRKSGAWTNRTVAQVRTDLGVARGGILNHGQNALPSGRYISNSLTQASTAQNFTPNNLWFCPFVAPFDVTIDRLCVEVTTAGAASSLGRIGIYAVTGGVPAALIRDAGTFDGSALGVKELTLDPTVTLSGGTNYAFAFFHNSGSNMAMRVFSFVGAMQLSEAAAGGNVTSPRRSWNRSLTFTTLPDPAGTVTHETVLPVSFYMRGV